jgi:hypothetical protein
MNTPVLYIPLLLSEPTAVDPTPLFIMFLVVVVTVPLAWWGGVKLVRSTKIVLKCIGAVVLLYGLSNALTELYFLLALMGVVRM